jgi:hypothetical protein
LKHSAIGHSTRAKRIRNGLEAIRETCDDWISFDRVTCWTRSSYRSVSKRSGIEDYTGCQEQPGNNIGRRSSHNKATLSQHPTKTSLCIGDFERPRHCEYTAHKTLSHPLSHSHLAGITISDIPRSSLSLLSHTLCARITQVLRRASALKAFTSSLQHTTPCGYHEYHGRQ